MIRVMMVMLLCVGCGQSALEKQAIAMSSMSSVVDSVTHIVQDESKREQDAAIDSICQDRMPCPYPDFDKAEAEVLKIQDRWHVVFEAHRALRAAHDTWRETVQTAALLHEEGNASWPRMIKVVIDTYKRFATVYQEVSGHTLPSIPSVVIEEAK